VNGLLQYICLFQGLVWIYREEHLRPVIRNNTVNNRDVDPLPLNVRTTCSNPMTDAIVLFVERNYIW
jgi:hypothetical protein